MPALEDGEFDFIIVGAGSAGCVLANRLSADPDTRVCLIEAGPDDASPWIDTPMGIVGLLRGRRYNWGYDTEPQTALDGRRLYWPRGKTLGGSSSINAMIYTRGHPQDYDAWAAAGNPGWSWDDVLPVFRAHECQQHGASAAHGDAGPLHVSDPVQVNPLSRCFLEAALQAGVPACDDFNAGEAMEGAGLYQLTQWQGRRWSAARAFLDPLRQRPNLQVRTGCLATRVEFEQRRARAVQVLQDGRSARLRARREIVLCGGAVNSPQLLQLSGIGPAPELRRLGIDVLLHAPGVGANLQDHLDVTLSARVRGHDAVGVGPAMLPRLLRAAWAYRRHHRGLLASNAAEAGAFVRSSPALGIPDLQWHFLPSLLRDHGRRLVWGYGVTVHVCQLRPHSRGRIALGSPDPLQPPRIDPGYLQAESDRFTLREGLRQVHALFAQPAWQARGARRCELPQPRPSDAELDAHIRARAETIYHPVGTCRMGAGDDAVVDSDLRVRGVDGLRVADASIMPSLIGGNTNAPCMMIGEMAARRILARA